MKKLSVFFLFSAMFVFFSFSFVMFAQDESEISVNLKAELQERLNALNAENEAISVLRSAINDEYAKRKADYDTKCKGNFRLETENEKQVYKKCLEEREWFVSIQKSLTERKQKYNENLAQYKLDMNALQKATATELQERLNTLNIENEAISAIKDEYSKRKPQYDTKCKGKSFDLADKGQEQIAKECKKESEWLISSQKSIKERQKSYNEDFARYKLDMNAFQKDTAATNDLDYFL